MATVKRTAALGIPHYLVKPIQRAQLETMLVSVAADGKTVRIAHVEVMNRIGLDEEGYGSTVEEFSSLIGDQVTRLRAGVTLDVTDLRALVEAAPVFGRDHLHGLAVRLLKWGPPEVSQDDLVHLKRELLLIRRSLQWRPSGTPSASGSSA